MILKKIESLSRPRSLDSFFSGLDAKKIHNISSYETTIEKHFYRSL